MINQEILYFEMAKLSLENATDLYGEAMSFFEVGRFPRAYVLLITSIEEQAKSYLCKCISTKVSKPEDLRTEENGRIRYVIRDHNFKQRFIGTMVATGQAFSDNKERLLSINPSQTVDIQSLNLDEAKKIIKQFKAMETDRQNGLYVGIEGSILYSPKSQITKAKCEKLLPYFPSLLAYLQGLIEMPTENFVEWHREFSIQEEIK